MAGNPKLKSHCNTCKREQKQAIIAVHRESFVDREEGVSSDTDWEIVQCGGCGDFSFRTVLWFSENYDDDGREYPVVTSYPPAATIEAKDFPYVPRKIREVYKEVVKAFSNGAYVLCAAGLRAIIDGICSEQKIRTGPVRVKTKSGYKLQRKKDLRGKIEGMLDRGIITKVHRNILHQHRYLGNEAVHELECPAADELGAAIKIVEHTLEHIYELPKSAEEMSTLSKARKDKLKRFRRKPSARVKASLAPIPPSAPSPSAAPPVPPSATSP
jgi:hypothetical protein